MALFEIDNGRLAPAQFGRPADEDAQDEALAAVRQQIVEVLHRPLFPVVWESEAGGETLTALDPAGQVVTVEVVRILDSATIVGAMARLASTAASGWADLAGRYQGGMQAFREDWNEFREAMPARVEPGPRLIVVAVEMADDVRTSLAVLSRSGVETHHLSVRQLASGRRFLEVEKVEPELVQGTMPLLMSRATRPALAAPGGEPRVAPVPVAADPLTAPTPVAEPDDEPEESADGVGPERDAAAGPADASEDTPAAGQPTVTQPVPTARAAAPDDAPAASGRGEHWAPEQEDPAEPEPMSPEDAAAALSTVAASLDGPAQVVWQSLRRGIFHEATIAPDGVLTLGDGRTFTDPSQAADVAQGEEGWDGWRVWRFGVHGPSLREALDEVTSARDRQDAAAEAGQDAVSQRRPRGLRRRRAR